MSERSLSSWEAPVTDALNQVERLPGFEPDRIGWDHFQFHGSKAARRMELVSIYAHLPPSPVPTFVRFAITSEGFTVTGPGHRDLSISEVARMLKVPIESAEKAVAELETALTAARTEWNAADRSGAISHTVRLSRHTPQPPSRRSNPAADKPPPGIDL